MMLCTGKGTIIRDNPSITLALVLVLTLAAVPLAWQALPLIQVAILGSAGEPRTVTARGDLAATETATIELFEAAKNGVVSITTAERVVNRFTRNAYDVPRGTGSGFVWDSQGHVVTNAHVLRGASSAKVRLADGRSFDAALVGADATNDLAVLKIGVRPGALPPIPIGASEDLQVGQSVFAIGNPFGLDWTLTTGIISALDRELPNRSGGMITDLIQSDAAINPGNSGGPLIDSAGRLIGVNTAIYSPSGSSAGIGFAIPVATVNRVVPQLIAEGEYRPPTLGVRADARADRMLKREGLSGVLVLGVDPGSPADRAGIEPARVSRDGSLVPGDVIVAIGGETVANVEEMRARVGTMNAGDTVQVTVMRDGTRRTLEVELESAG